MTRRRARLAACLVLAGMAFAADEPAKATAEEGMQRLLILASDADRALDGARAALNLGARRARARFTEAAAAKPQDLRTREQIEGQRFMASFSKGWVEMMLCLSEGHRRLEEARQSLDLARQTRADTDALLAAERKRLAESLQKAVENVEVARARVKSAWDHSQSARLPLDPETRASALARVNVELSASLAVWRELEFAQARLRFVEDRRRRLAQADQEIARRLADTALLQDNVARWLASLANPLDEPPPKSPPDRLTWPPGLRAAIEALGDKFTPPPPYQPDPAMPARDRAARFFKGGAP